MSRRRRGVPHRQGKGRPDCALSISRVGNMAGLLWCETPLGSTPGMGRGYPFRAPDVWMMERLVGLRVDSDHVA